MSQSPSECGCGERIITGFHIHHHHGNHDILTSVMALVLKLIQFGDSNWMFLKHLFCLSILFLFMFVCVLWPCLCPLDGLLACAASSDLQVPLDRLRSASANCLSPDNHVPSAESDRYQPLPPTPLR